MAALSAVVCPRCGSSASRIFTAPLLSQLSAPLRDAFAREARSTHEPEVVRRVARGQK